VVHMAGAASDPVRSKPLTSARNVPTGPRLQFSKAEAPEL